MPNDYRGRSGDIHSRGIVNNNPGNVRPTAIPWLGQVGIDDKNFAIFADISYGIRAWLSNFYSSIKKHHTDSLISYVTRYAPASDGNNPEIYADTMSKKTGIPVDASIPLDKNDISNIMLAQFSIELGDEYMQYITQDDVSSGFDKLDSPLQSFFGAASTYINNYPIYSFGAASALLISVSLITWAAVRIIKRKK